MTYTRNPLPNAGPIPAMPQPPRPDCKYLGDPLPRQDGPCVFKLRRCDVFEVCTVEPCDKSPHSCNRPDGTASACYVAKVDTERID